MTRFIALASGKGGTGKTTTAINLGTAMSEFGREVIVLDANVSKPNISIHLGTPKLKFTLHDALKGARHITEVAYLHPSGLKVIPGHISLEETENANIKRLREVLLDLVGTGEIVLLDVSSGVGEEVKETLKAVDDLLVVTNPELPAVADALKIIRIAESVGCNVMGVIVNRVTGDKPEMVLENIEHILEKPIVGVIPEDPTVKKALAVKHPVVYTHPDSSSSIAFKKLAARLLGESYREKIEKEEGSSMFTYMLKGLGLK